MKMIALGVACLSLVTTSALAQVSVNGHYRSDGTYVAPHYRSNPNNTTRDNWSVRPNVNPYTGRVGTRAPSDAMPQSLYGSQSRSNTNSSSTNRSSAWGQTTTSGSRSSSYGTPPRSNTWGSGPNYRY